MTINTHNRALIERGPIEHELKTWPGPFDAIAAGLKPWEFRKADRDYRVGDTLWLRKWSPTEGYWGDGVDLRRTASFILEGGAFGIPEGYCIMSLDATRAEGPVQEKRICSLTKMVCQFIDCVNECGSDYTHATCPNNQAAVTPPADEVGRARERLDEIMGGNADPIGRYAEDISLILSHVSRLEGDNERLKASPWVVDEGFRDTDDLLDMGRVGQALIERIDEVRRMPGWEHWLPADSPTEIVIDLINALNDAATEQESAYATARDSEASADSWLAEHKMSETRAQSAEASLKLAVEALEEIKKGREDGTFPLSAGTARIIAEDTLKSISSLRHEDMPLAPGGDAEASRQSGGEG